ncbi:glycyl-radical enzyme activating protein [Desulfitobacterium chlororespirans]|uniref:Pyruvate formate lyase activating enzyme n=1 Tax=Desulfitobacterium chlororespirans DSM 11544 TaxID=1121395 RepID=A0A1M7UG23_9FIRM|nr:glycyl-radical enzyme activating protein [Desulfitobacterium chlororespirans]SHN81953.1 pyruvate formate lyase activating enzyme [Desulfitobacterium chlororespirans DSM 11544]
MTNAEANSGKKAVIFNVQRYSTEDGPGVRTTVFFKGCPLSCLWCSNPESQQAKPQMMYFSKTCVQCYACVKACPNGANKIKDDGSVWVDRSVCTNCGVCVKVCLADARSMSGKKMTVDEVFDIIQKDSLYYINSGGGVTLGGGECTTEPEFVGELLDRCYDRAIHTCIDTCGYTPWSVLEKILPKVELVLFDIKHMDTEKHKELTGVGNELILENAVKIKQMGTRMIIRLPLIPGYNDDENNIKVMGWFMESWGMDRIDILPYHRLGENKYDALGMNYSLGDLPNLAKDSISRAVKILGSYGLEVHVM